ncbi:MAG TPA: feruloyl-CoA synthase [Polyangiaceae bacterium]|nr:feruloyl-CoA synthase [Polyangiaceae bacterium]
MFAPPAVDLLEHPDGSLLLRSRQSLKRYERCIGEYLQRWAAAAPARPFLMERGRDGRWQGVTYREALEQVRRIGTWLLERNLSAERPVVVLSENSVEHGLLLLACQYVGVPIAPISPAYALLSKDFGKLTRIVEALRPGVIYLSDRVRFGPALAAIRGLHDAVVVAGDGAADDGVLSFDALGLEVDLAAVGAAFAAVTPDTIAKFLFTSGSTDEPKAVVNTHRMLCANQQAIRQLWPFLDEPPVLVDWLPWHHTFGGNHNFNLTLCNGGTLYIDGGRPVAGQFETTLENLREIAPTVVFNVPRAYDLLTAALRADVELRQRFFGNVRLLFYAAAALPQHVWDGLRSLARETLGREVPLVSSWGLTETAPAATSCHYRAERAGVVGLPIPGCELKLVAAGETLEARVRGPHVTPGYWKQPALTAESFDEEGFFRTGDAMRLVDADRPERGLLFDGRLGENFKLSTGTWVHVCVLRLKALAALAAVAQDLVVTGHDRHEIGLLVIPNLNACRALCALDADAPATVLISHPAVRAQVAAGLAELARSRSGSSTHPVRALVMLEPPSIDAGEITDKGYINQRAVLIRRAALVERLHAVPKDPDVILPDDARGTNHLGSS